SRSALMRGSRIDRICLSTIDIACIRTTRVRAYHAVLLPSEPSGFWYGLLVCGGSLLMWPCSSLKPRTSQLQGWGGDLLDCLFERRRDRFSDRRGWLAREPAQALAVVVERALARQCAGAGEHGCDGRRQARTFERPGVVVSAVVDVFDPAARLARDFRSEILHRPGFVAGELIDVTALAAKEGRSGAGSEVGAGRGGQLALADRSEDLPAFQRGGETHRVVLGIPAVAQHVIVEAAVRQQLLGRHVFGRERERRLVAFQDRGVGEVGDTRCL